MTITAKDLLMAEMRTNPDLILSVTEVNPERLYVVVTGLGRRFHLSPSVDGNTHMTLCGREVYRSYGATLFIPGHDEPDCRTCVRQAIIWAARQPKPCTHAGITQAHLDECCADSVDCDRCGDPIPGIDPATVRLGDIRVCPPCTADLSNGEDA